MDRETQAVVLADAQRLSYDYLVLATGARHAYFGREEWEGLAPGLKQIDDATRIRRRLLVAFEEAENAADPRVQQQWLTFVIVGGGPTGVELAGAIAELARHGMEREFRNIDPAAARVVLVQSGPRILPTFPEPLSVFAEQTLKKLGVEIFTNNRVQDVDDTGVIVSGRRLEAHTVFWAAGVMASPVAQWLDAEADSAGRLKVAPDLTAPGFPNVYAIGDTALSQGWNGEAVPGLAPAAKQGGAYVAGISEPGSKGARSQDPSFTPISVASPPSGARPPWPISAGCGSRAPWPGGCGERCISCSWSGREADCRWPCSGSGLTSPSSGAPG